MLRQQRQSQVSGGPDCAVALVAANGAVWGLASLMPDPIWPDQDVLDIFCHPGAWSHAAEMLAAIPAKSLRACVAYADVGATAKAAVLSAAGFTRVSDLPGWLPGRADAVLWRRAA